jgi:hypothetical protein
MSLPFRLLYKYVNDTHPVEVLAVLKLKDGKLIPEYCCRVSIDVEEFPPAPSGISVVSMRLLTGYNLFNLLDYSDGIYKDSFGNEVKEGGSVCFVKDDIYYFMWESTSISKYFTPTTEMQWSQIGTNGEGHPIALYLIESGSTTCLDLCIDKIIRPAVEAISDKRVLIAVWNSELNSFCFEFHNMDSIVLCADIE